MLHLNFFCAIVNKLKKSGCSAVGSVLEWGSRGRAFKSPHSDFEKRPKSLWFRSFLYSENHTQGLSFSEYKKLPAKPAGFLLHVKNYDMPERSGRLGYYRSYSNRRQPAATACGNRNKHRQTTARGMQALQKSTAPTFSTKS